MAPPPGDDRWEKDEDDRGPPSWRTEPAPLPTIAPVPAPVTIPDVIVSNIFVSNVTPMILPTESISVTTSAWGPGPGYTEKPDPKPGPPPSERPDGRPSDRPGPPPPEHETSSTRSSQSYTSVTTAYADHWGSSSSWTTSISTSAIDGILPVSPTGPPNGPPPDWNLPQKPSNYGPIYAAAAIIPIVVLALIGVVIFLCLRKRKARRSAEAVASTSASLTPPSKFAQEMKMHPPPQHPRGVRAYMAPPPPPPLSSLPPMQIAAISLSRQHHTLPPTSTPHTSHPIILGPIVSSPSNGAYLTGMDTSDMVSVSSNPHTNLLGPMVDPFSDNGSLTEAPPPPYRERSLRDAPPPSFRSNSTATPSLRSQGQDSLMGRGGVGEGERMGLVDRSPFDDPDGDGVSVLSGAEMGRDADGDWGSAVSDLEYQRDMFGGGNRGNM